MGKKSKTLGNVTMIDTERFSNTAEAFKTAINSFQASRTKIKNATNTLLDTWQGEARNIFENKYELFISKLGDIEDILIEYYNALLDAEMAYREADEATGKEILKSLEPTKP